MPGIEQTFLTFPSSRLPPKSGQDQVPPSHHPHDGSRVAGRPLKKLNIVASATVERGKARLHRLHKQQGRDPHEIAALQTWSVRDHKKGQGPVALPLISSASILDNGRLTRPATLPDAAAAYHSPRAGPAPPVTTQQTTAQGRFGGCT